MADEQDRHPDDIIEGQAHVHRLTLERIFVMPESPSEADRLRAVLPLSARHARTLKTRLDVLEGRLPEVKDFLGVLIAPGARVVYVSPGMRPKLAHGVVVGIEPGRRLHQGVVQVHITTSKGTHARLFDPARIIVLTNAAS